MKNQDELDQLRRVDEATAGKISEQYPADWDMDAVFRESMRKYRQMQGGDAEPFTAKPQRSIKIHINRWVTAACLILTAGIAGAVGYAQLSAAKPDVVSPDSVSPAVTELTDPAAEPNTVTTAAGSEPQSAEKTTETVSAEAAVQTVTVSAGTEPSPSGSTAEAETESAPAEHTDAPQQTAATTAPHRSGSWNAQTEVKQTGTEARQTTARRPETTAPVTKRADSEDTLPAPVADVPTVPDEPERPSSSSDNSAPKGEGSFAENGDPSSETGQLIMIDDRSRSDTEFYIEFRFEDQTPYPNPAFSVDLDGYSAETEFVNEYNYSNKITAPDGTLYYPYFSSGVRSWSVFQREAYPRWETAEVNGNPAYMLYGPKATTLVWFDGRYVVRMHTNRGTDEELLKIAEALISH